MTNMKGDRDMDSTINNENILPCVDEWAQAENCSHNALFVHNKLSTGKTVAIPLTIGNVTLFHISFVPLNVTIPMNARYDDGTNGHGIQINIDRKSSYAVNWKNPITDQTYLAEKWDLSAGDSKLMLLFINTVLTGQDYFHDYGKDVMHKIIKGRSSKQAFIDEVNAPDDNDEAPF